MSIVVLFAKIMPRISASLKEFSPLMTALLDAKMDMRLLLRKKPFTVYMYLMLLFESGKNANLHTT